MSRALTTVPKVPWPSSLICRHETHLSHPHAGEQCTCGQSAGPQAHLDEVLAARQEPRIIVGSERPLRLAHILVSLVARLGRWSSSGPGHNRLSCVPGHGSRAADLHSHRACICSPGCWTGRHSRQDWDEVLRQLVREFCHYSISPSALVAGAH